MPAGVARRLKISSSPKHDVIGLGSGKLKRCLNIRLLKIRVVVQDVFLRDSSRKEIQEILYPHPHATNAWTPPTLLRIDRDAAQ